MTDIKVKMRNGEIEIYMVGHAEDIVVCAGLSARVQTCVVGLMSSADENHEGVKMNV